MTLEAFNFLNHFNSFSGKCFGTDLCLGCLSICPSVLPMLIAHMHTHSRGQTLPVMQRDVFSLPPPPPSLSLYLSLEIIYIKKKSYMIF